MSRLLAALLLSVWSTYAQAQGVATYYSGPGDNPATGTYVPSFGILAGSCGYGELNRDDWPYWAAASLGPANPLLAAGLNDGCGICIQVSCTDTSCTPGSPPVTVFVTDSCSTCAPNQINMHISAFAKLAPAVIGKLAISYQQVPCTPPGNMVVKVVAYQPPPAAYIRLVLLSVAGSGAIASVQIRSSGVTTWSPLANNFGATWEGGSFGAPPYDLLITTPGSAPVVAMGAITSGSVGQYLTNVQPGAAVPQTTPPPAAPQPVPTPAAPAPSPPALQSTTFGTPPPVLQQPPVTALPPVTATLATTVPSPAAVTPATPSPVLSPALPASPVPVPVPAPSLPPASPAQSAVNLAAPPRSALIPLPPTPTGSVVMAASPGALPRAPSELTPIGAATLTGASRPVYIPLDSLVSHSGSGKASTAPAPAVAMAPAMVRAPTGSHTPPTPAAAVPPTLLAPAPARAPYKPPAALAPAPALNHTIISTTRPAPAPAPTIVAPGAMPVATASRMAPAASAPVASAAPSPTSGPALAPALPPVPGPDISFTLLQAAAGLARAADAPAGILSSGTSNSGNPSPTPADVNLALSLVAATTGGSADVNSAVSSIINPTVQLRAASPTSPTAPAGRKLLQG